MLPVCSALWAPRYLPDGAENPDTKIKAFQVPLEWREWDGSPSCEMWKGGITSAGVSFVYVCSFPLSQIKASYLEIYMGSVNDLLDPRKKDLKVSP